MNNINWKLPEQLELSIAFTVAVCVAAAGIFLTQLDGFTSQHVILITVGTFTAMLAPAVGIDKDKNKFEFIMSMFFPVPFLIVTLLVTGLW